MQMSAPYRNFKNASVDSDIAVNCEARRERVVVLVGVVFFLRKGNSSACSMMIERSPQWNRREVKICNQMANEDAQNAARHKQKLFKLKKKQSKKQKKTYKSSRG